MLIQLGNPAPIGAVDGQPAVTYIHVPEVYSIEPGLDLDDYRNHLDETMRAPGPRQGITNLPGAEAFLAATHPSGAWAFHTAQSYRGPVQPTWATSDDPEMERLLQSFYGVDGPPADLDDTHWREFGSSSFPPGAIPDPASEITALLTNAGRDIWAANLWSALGSATVLGLTGTATATSSTSLTGGTESGTPTHVANDAAGQIIVAWNTGAYGIVTANTSGTSPVYTVDRWYTPNNPGGSAASTPSSTSGYTLLAGGPPALFMGISANASAVNMTDTTLPGEITTSGGGLIRKISVMAHTAGANTTTSTAVFTANGTDSLPVTIAKMAIGPSIVATYKNALQTLLSSTATLNVSGDQLTITDTITGS